MLIDEILYISQKWIDDEERCLKAKMPPEEIKFRTKHELGLEMIDNAIEEGIPFSYVTMDGFYGEGLREHFRMQKETVEWKNIW